VFIRHEERLRRSGRHYESWKQRVTDEAGILQEIEWDNGVRSFYFHDPAGMCWKLPTAISGRSTRRMAPSSG
jgi:hypothetical protein